MRTTESFHALSTVTGYSATAAQAILRSAGRHESIFCDGMMIHLSATASLVPGETMLVVTSETKEAPREMCLIATIDTTIVERPSELSPTALLRRFAARFGFFMDFGSGRRQLVLGETIITTGPGIEIANNGRPFASVMLLRNYEVDGEHRAACALCLAVDIEGYQAHLANRRLAR